MGDPIGTDKAGAVADKPAFTVLCVDDEKNILSALRRLLHPCGYRVLLAEGGAEALALMDKEPVDLVISDMRMPEMSGAQFLAEVRKRWPSAVRLLLTGYADIASAIEAINLAQVQRYLTKPWQDEDLLAIVGEALERKALIRDKIRLETQNRKQNEELKRLNSNLEAEVRKRTEELRQAMSFMELANEKLKRSFMATVRALSGLIEMRGYSLAYSLEVGEQARSLAIRMGLEEAKVQDVLIAGLLHDIGLIAMPDAILDKPFSALNTEERTLYMRHPVRGVEALAEIEQLQGALEMIRSHHEHFNGSGYPDGISGLEIPLGARIVAVAADYQDLIRGTLTTNPMRRSEAKAYIQEMRGSRYDPSVVDAFMEMLAAMSAGIAEQPEEVQIRITALRPGMVVARDVIMPDGVLLLSKGYVLNQSLIDQIVQLDKTESLGLKIYIAQ